MVWTNGVLTTTLRGRQELPNPLLSTHPLDGRVAESGLHSDDSAGEDASQAVGAEARAEDALNLVLQDHAGLVTAQVAHGCGRQRGRDPKGYRVRGSWVKTSDESFKYCSVS